MSVRPEKAAVVKEIQGLVDESSFVLLADYLGLSVDQLAALRASLRKEDASMMVVKNRLLIQAVRDTEWEEIKKLVGPTALISGNGDVTAVAKALIQFKKDNTLPEVKGGRMGTTPLSVDDVIALASIPPREIMLGRLVGTIAAPMSQLVGVMRQKVLTLLYVLKAAEEKKSKA